MTHIDWAILSLAVSVACTLVIAYTAYQRTK